MHFWIVTGGAASGKSQFCERAARLHPGLEVFSSDAVVHTCLGEAEFSAELGSLFGEAVIGPDKLVDRAKLRELVFADKTARGQLESLLHPMVYAELTAALEVARRKEINLFLAEVPLFFEGNRELKPDRIILVAAQAQLQIQRIIDKRGLTGLAAANILEAQLPLEKKIALADVVVWNEGDPSLLEMQVEYLLQQIL